MLLLTLFGWSMGRAIIVLTLAIRAAMFKNSAATMQMQQSMWDNKMRDKQKKIQELHKDDPQKQVKEMMGLMKKDGMWPLKWCKAMLLQIPIFLGLYWVISNFATYWDTEASKARLSFDLPYTEQIYSFLTTTTAKYIDIAWWNVDTVFFGIDLLEKGSLVLAIITMVLMIWNMFITSIVKPAPKMKQTLPNGQAMPDMSKAMQPMMYGMWVFMWVIVYSLAAWVGLYMMTTTLFSLWQTLWFNRALLQAKRRAKFHPEAGEIIEG